MGSPTKLAHAMFWWGEAKAGVAFMPPRGIRCEVPSEGTRPQGRGVPKYKKNPTFASIAGFFLKYFVFYYRTAIFPGIFQISSSGN